MFWSIVVTGCEWNWILPVSDLVLNPRSTSWRKSTVYGLNGLRPTLRVGALDLNPRPLRALAPTASFRGPLRFASLTPEKYVTAYFPVLSRASKESRRWSQNVGKLLGP